MWFQAQRSPASFPEDPLVPVPHSAEASILCLRDYRLHMCPCTATTLWVTWYALCKRLLMQPLSRPVVRPLQLGVRALLCTILFHVCSLPQIRNPGRPPTATTMTVS